MEACTPGAGKYSQHHASAGVSALYAFSVIISDVALWASAVAGCGKGLARKLDDGEV
jgi:hypothetical protein